MTKRFRAILDNYKEDFLLILLRFDNYIPYIKNVSLSENWQGRHNLYKDCMNCQGLGLLLMFHLGETLSSIQKYLSITMHYICKHCLEITTSR